MRQRPSVAAKGTRPSAARFFRGPFLAAGSCMRRSGHSTTVGGVPMVHLSSVLAAGLVGVLAWDFYAAPRALDATTDASVVASADVVATVRTGATPATAVDRTLKGDRLLRMPDGNSARPEIT